MIPYRWKPPLSPAPSPIPKPENPLDGHLPSEQQRYLLQGTNQTEACTHTKVFSKPSVDIYCFPSPQLAVKHLIQQLWPRANSALRTLSATSLGQDAQNAQQGTWMTCCGAFYVWDSHLIHLKPAVISIFRNWKKCFLKIWDFPGIIKTSLCDSYRQGLPPHLVV